MHSGIRLTWWQRALLAIALSALGGLSTLQTKKQQRNLYEKKLKQAPWAPPGWIFGPAWSMNNFFLLKGLQELLIRDDIPEKNKLLLQQAIIWVIFFSFGYVYFKKKSTILAAVWTIADAVLAANSFITARKSARHLSYTYLPLLAWTFFASTVAVYQAIKNEDRWLSH